MRLKKEMIEHISRRLANSLLEEELILFDGKRGDLPRIIKMIITEELSLEDKLNDEVKEIINAHHDLVDKADTDYGRIFQVVKSKLVKERDLIL